MELAIPSEGILIAFTTMNGRKVLAGNLWRLAIPACIWLYWESVTLGDSMR